MKKSLTSMISRIMVILFAIIAGAGIYLFNAQSIAGNPMPMPFGVGAAVVLSGSMEPTLSVNDLVFVAEAESYGEGDVVVFEENGNLIIHRIVSISGEELITQGDANNVSDAPIERSAIRGKLIFHIPAIGAVIQLMKTPTGIIAVLAAAVLLSELSYRKDKEEDEENLENMKEEIRKLRKELNEREE